MSYDRRSLICYRGTGDAMRFEIRHLLIITAIVALLIAFWPTTPKIDGQRLTPEEIDVIRGIRKHRIRASLNTRLPAPNREAVRKANDIETKRRRRKTINGPINQIPRATDTLDA